MREEVMDFDRDLIEAEEDFVIDAQFLLQDLMSNHNITRADLARKAGVSKARLTHLFKPDANPTLRTLARLFYALGEKPVVSSASRQINKGAEAVAKTWVDCDTDKDASSVSRKSQTVVAFKSVYTEALKHARFAPTAYQVEASNDSAPEAVEPVAA